MSGSEGDAVGMLLGAIAIGLSLSTLCLLVHLSVLRRLARFAQHAEEVKRPMLRVLAGLFAAHLAEILIFSLAISAMDVAGLGTLAGTVDQGPGWFADHFYFSIASYTTLGIGDIAPHGMMRIVTGMEALCGLVLIAWSASFTYLVMEKLWGSIMPADRGS